MKKIVVLSVVMCLGILLAGCGGQKTALDTGIALKKNGDCVRAVQLFDETIDTPPSILELAYAYYLKAQCAEKDGNTVAAYENYYAAKVVVCYSVARADRTTFNVVARSEYCQRILPKKLNEIGPSLGKDKAAALRAKVDKELTAKYMEHYASSRD